MSKFIDTLGDIFGTSEFSKEKKVWMKAIGTEITRKEYNTHPEEFLFREADVLRLSYGEYTTKPDITWSLKNAVDIGIGYRFNDHVKTLVSMWTKNEKLASDAVVSANKRMEKLAEKMDEIGKKCNFKQMPRPAYQHLQ